MATLASLMIRLGVDTRGVKTDMKKGTKEAEDEGKKSGGKWSSGFSGALKTGLAAGGFAAAFTAIGGQISDSLNAYKEAQASQQQLQDAFARFPALADTNIGSLQSLNSELAKKTKFDDDAYASGQAVLANFGLTGQQIASLTPLLGDYAAKTGKELPDAAGTLGKAFLGNTRALKELGIDYTSTGDKAKDVENITALLRSQVGGFAEEQGKTAAGQAEILSNKFGEIKETIGGKLMPVLERLAPMLENVLGFLADNADVLGPLALGIAAVVIAQWAWNAAMAANPVTLVILAIIALIAIIVLIIKHWDDVKAAGGKAWDWIKDKGIDFWNWLKDLPGKVGNAFAGMGETVKGAFKTALNWIIDRLNDVIHALNRGIEGANRLNPFSDIPHIPDIPRMHTGGIVDGVGDQPIMANGGEGVFTREQMAALAPVGAGGPTVVEFRSSGSRLDDLLIELILRAVRKDPGARAKLSAALAAGV